MKLSLLITSLSFLILSSCSSYKASKKSRSISSQVKYLKASCELKEEAIFNGARISYLGLYSPYSLNDSWRHNSYLLILFDQDRKVIEIVSNQSKGTDYTSYSDSKRADIHTASRQSGNTTKLHLLMKSTYIERLDQFLDEKRSIPSKIAAKCISRPYPLNREDTNLFLSIKDF